jgi:hypothetical protein
VAQTSPAARSRSPIPWWRCRSRLRPIPSISTFVEPVLLTSCSRGNDTRGHGTTPDDTERHGRSGSVRDASNLRIRWPRGRGSSSLPSRTHRASDLEASWRRRVPWKAGVAHGDPVFPVHLAVDRESQTFIRASSAHVVVEDVQPHHPTLAQETTDDLCPDAMTCISGRISMRER